MHPVHPHWALVPAFNGDDGCNSTKRKTIRKKIDLFFLFLLAFYFGRSHRIPIMKTITLSYSKFHGGFIAVDETSFNLAREVFPVDPEINQDCERFWLEPDVAEFIKSLPELPKRERVKVEFV